ncbi:MAG: ABC transporter permease [Gammaproteobacteria bacterium]|nr:MAG: ABC transporter permease [Gammaproteobacteria bacterium]
MKWNWNVIFDSLPTLFEASILTAKLVILSGILGLFFGIIIGLLRANKNRWVQALPFAFIFFFRGTPLLVQIFLVYAGLGQFDFIRESVLWEPVFKQAFWCAIIAFTLNTSAYIAEIVRGAIEAIPKGELEAADAIGMSQLQKLFRITLPRAFGIMIPAYSNEVIFMLKGSALASTITLVELTRAAQKIGTKTYAVIEMYFAAGIFYLVLSWLFMWLFRSLEKRFNKHNQDVVLPETAAGTIAHS